MAPAKRASRAAKRPEPRIDNRRLLFLGALDPRRQAEIEDIRGVTTSKGTLDVLLETGWIRLRGRRKAPGRPVTYGTNEAFLSHFGLEALNDLPGLDELKGAGLIEATLPVGFSVPVPSDDPALRDDEDPLEPGDLDLGLAPPAGRSEE